MKIYLAGKIRKECWRENIVAGLRGAWTTEIVRGPFTWPILSCAIFGEHDYVGPYFIDCGHDCYYETAHAAGTIDRTSEGVPHCLAWNEPPFIPPSPVVTACLRAIDLADLIFAWIDGPEPYGTAAEIAYAYAKGKRIVIAESTEVSHLDEEMWFVGQLGAVVRPGAEVEGWSAKAALHKYLKPAAVWPASQTAESYVYFIEAEGLERIKIGRAADPQRRLLQLQTASPAPLRLVCSIPGGSFEEESMHKLFASDRIQLEWFHATPRVRAFITRLLARPDTLRT